LPEYFHEDTMREILQARDYFIDNREDTAEWYLVFSCMLHILHGNRPYALSRRSHPVTPVAPTGPYVYKSVIEKLKNKVIKSLQVEYPQEYIKGYCYQSNILSKGSDNIPKLDAIITSPPFFDSTRFYMTNWMRYWFAGWSRSDFDTQPKNFIEEIQKKNFKIYDDILNQCYRHLKGKGIIVFHLGYSKKCDMGEELSKIASQRFRIVGNVTETVEHCEKHGIRDKGTVKGHQYLILEKK
jgi:hypothetical protein